jgi:hypothetical protein
MGTGFQAAARDFADRLQWVLLDSRLSDYSGTKKRIECSTFTSSTKYINLDTQIL